MLTKSGIQIKRNAKGKATHIVIDLRKHPQAISVLKENSLIPESNFQKRCEKGITTAELEASLQQLVTDFYAVKHNR